jgi:SAM-dependent methyltransferase
MHLGAQKDKIMKNCLCKRVDFDSEWLLRWKPELKTDFGIHRKLWELAAIAQTVSEKGLLKEGSTGLGFGVGKEQLPALFAKYGCKITATDLDVNDLRCVDWKNTNQLLENKADLNVSNVCDPETFDKNVVCKVADMANISPDLKDFDFVWSCGSFEHIGGMKTSLSFFREHMKCLKPGGWAIHTTEYNFSSDITTVDLPNMVFFRKRDLEQLVSDVRSDGHFMEDIDFTRGSTPDDLLLDNPPYNRGPVHISLNILGCHITSVLLIAQRGK